jgi:mRNA interferase RelE/StbE
MKIEIHSAFVKAAKKLSPELQHKIAEIIEQIQAAKSIREISNCKKLTGYKTAYRIKFESYRIGFFLQKGVIELTTVMHRKEIYRYFP